MNQLVYKIVTPSEWEAASSIGIYNGAPVDIKDGYIHLSSADQVEETAAKHFHGKDDLLLIAFEAEALGASLAWEPSRGGALFPHLYDTLDPSLASAVYRLEKRTDGSHVFPRKY